MRFAFIGAGAVGGWFGGKLLAAGHDVAFVARGDTLQVLRDEGLRLNDEPPVAVRAAGSLAKLGECDVVFLTVKATADVELERALAGLGPDVPVAVTQNAVEMPARVAALVGADRTWPGVVRGFFHHVGPARVEFHGGPASYVFGTYDATPDPRADEVAVALTDAGIASRVHPEIFVDVWEKAMFVTCFGALGAVTGKPLGHLRTELRVSLEALMREVYHVARAEGVPLDTDAVERTLAFADRMPASSTSSMQRDIAGGDPGELDAQVGAIVRMGNARGVDVRMHEEILALLAD